MFENFVESWLSEPYVAGMKKTNAARTQTQPATSKKLFGVPAEKLETVCGGSGVIAQSPLNATGNHT